MQKNNKEKTTGKIKVSEAEIKHISNKMTTVSKKKLTVGIVCASVLVAGLGGLAGYFGYKAMNNSGNNSSEVIVDPASKGDVTVSKFETVDGGDKLGTVTSNTKEITGVKVSIGSNLLIENEDYTAKAINESVSKWEVRIKQSALNKYKGSIVVAPTFDSTPTVEKFTVTFVSDGTTLSTQEVESGKCAVQPVNPTKEGCVFNGWYNGENKFDFKTPITSALTLNAHWDDEPAPVEEVIVTFDSAGGTSVSAQKITKGSTVAKPADPTKDKYKFNGWYDGDVEFDFNTQITSNITLTARWDLPIAVSGLSFNINYYDKERTCSVFYDGENNNLPSRFAIPSTAMIDGAEYKVTRLCAPAAISTVISGGGSGTAISAGKNRGAFQNCTKIIEIEIPDTVEFIDDDAFSGCTSLNKVKLPSKCISIGNRVFNRCTSLEEVNLEKGLLKIGDFAFGMCNNLKEVTIPDTVKEIGNTCFAGCTSLKTVTLGKALTKLGNAPFVECKSLESVNIPYSILTIEAGTFGGAEALKSVTFDDSESKWLDYKNEEVKSTEEIINKLVKGEPIYKKAFAIDESNKFVFHKLDESGDVAAYYYDKDAEEHGTGVVLGETVTVPAKVTVEDVEYNVVALSDGCFETVNDSSQLKTVTLPSTIVKIGESAFENLDGSDDGFSVIFNGSTSLKTISDNAFYESGISSFNSNESGCINLPEGLINLGNNAFDGCGHIKSVKIPSTLEDLKYFNYSIDLENYKSNSAYPFINCDSIASFEVAQENRYYYSNDKGLYEKESQTLLQAVGVVDESRTLNYIVSDNVKNIGFLAFENYDNVELTLSTSVKAISSDSLSRISKIVLNGNTNFTLDTNGGFYSKLNDDGDLKLLKVFVTEENKGDTFVLNSKTKIIGSYSFANTGFNTITLNDGLEEIDDYAFEDCGCSATALTIPSTVTSIGLCALDGLIEGTTTLTIDSEYAANLTSNATGIFYANAIKVKEGITVSESSYLRYYTKGETKEGYTTYTYTIG